MTTQELQKLIVLLRLDILDMIHLAQSGYPGDSLSALDMIATLYFGETLTHQPVFFCDPTKPQWEDQDYFVLSKAHAAPALYAVLAERGFFSKSELRHYRASGSLLQGFPALKIPGITAQAGVLGHGLSIGIGLALSMKLDRKPNRVYVFLGDEEFQQGEIWEGMLAASHYQLDNLCVIVDSNGFQADGFVREIVNVEPLQDKCEAFGWKVVKVLDGHNIEEFLFALEKAQTFHRRPTIIIAYTVKGKGISFIERKIAYHSLPLSSPEMQAARKELEHQLDSMY